MCDDDRSKKIPVTVVTGFLGSGKTTFIKRICEELRDFKVAVLQNEFSPEMGIEKPILLNAAADVFELPNGCICCSVKDGLVTAIETILQFKFKFDRLFIEAAGTADPVELTGSLWLDHALDSPLILDGVLAITDHSVIENVLHYSQGRCDSLDKPEELCKLAAKQLSVADVIIINKCDIERVPEEWLEMLKVLNATAKMIETSHCDFDVASVINLGMFQTSKILDFGFNKDTQHNHESKYKSVFVKTQGAYSLSFVNDFVSNLLWESEAAVYRCKAIFVAKRDCELIDVEDGGVGIFQLQGVGKLFEISSAETTSLESNKFLFIGSDIDYSYIEQKLSLN